MIIEFHLTADRQKVHAVSPQAELDAEGRALVGYQARGKQIVSIGDTAEDIRRNAPAFWEREGKNIVFVEPFDFGEAGAKGAGWEPLLAARVVQYYAEHAYRRIRRQSTWRLLVSPWVDRMDYTLDLAGFDRVSDKERAQFIKHLKQVLPAVKRITINGQTVVKR